MKQVVHVSDVSLNLVQVQVVFRHGARTPLHYVRSPITDTPWTKEVTSDMPHTLIPFNHIDLHSGKTVDENTIDLIYKPVILPGGVSIGMLTSIGQKDMYEIGVRLRKDYAESGLLLSDPPKLSEFNCRSTRVGRNIKSTRCLVAGLVGGHTLSKPLDILSIPFETEFLFPNIHNCPILEKLFIEGTNELRNYSRINNLKKQLKKALQVPRLSDELEKNRRSDSSDCQIYYVRDDYIARKHNGFPIPEELEPLFDKMHALSATELLCELLGKQRNWKLNLDITIGPVLHLLLSNMLAYSEIAPLQLISGHDSTLLPILLALDCFDGYWPPFGADISLELYSQTRGPSAASLLDNLPPATEKRLLKSSPFPNSAIQWSDHILDNFWLRVKYSGKPVPLASLWGLDSVVSTMNSGEYVPLRALVDLWTPMAVSLPDYGVLCKQASGRSVRPPNGIGYVGPRPV